MAHPISGPVSTRWRRSAPIRCRHFRPPTRREVASGNRDWSSDGAAGLGQFWSVRWTLRVGLPAHHRLGDAAPLLDRFVVGPIPSFGNGSEPALLIDALEAEPAVGELFGDGGSCLLGRAGPALLAAAALGGVGPVFFSCSALNETALSSRGMDLPHIPDPSLSILECSVSHRISCVVVGVYTKRCEILASGEALRTVD